MRHVTDRFSLAEIDLIPGQIQRKTAQLLNPDIKGHTRPERRLLKNHNKRFVMKRIAKAHGQAHDTSKDYEFTDWEALDTFINDFLTHNVGPGRRPDREAPPPAESRYQRILVATDYSDRAEHAIDSAAALARRWGAFLDVGHALDPPRVAG